MYECTSECTHEPLYAIYVDEEGNQQYLNADGRLMHILASGQTPKTYLINYRTGL